MVPCTIHNGGAHEKGIEFVKVPCEMCDGGIIGKALEKSGSLCNPRWRIHQKCVEVLGLCVTSEMKAFVEKAMEKSSSFHNPRSVDVVIFRKKFAMEALMEQRPKESASLCYPRWRNSRKR